MGLTRDSSSAIVYQVMDGLGWHDRPRPYFLTFYPSRTNCNGRVLHHKNPSGRSEASFQPQIYNRRACKKKAFHEQKQCDLRSRWRTSSCGESNPALVQEKLLQFIQKDEWPANSPDLNPTETYGVSSTKLHTEIPSLRRWED